MTWRLWLGLLPALLWGMAGPARASEAPAFVGLGPWFNSPPLSLAQLRGKVVLVDFWTLGCSNCVRTLPHVQAWHQRYQAQGLVVIGVHSPESPAERDPAQVLAAVRRHGLGYPVALDQDFRTWDAWHNAYWPALYLIDKQGRIVFQHVGEGGYERIESRIQQALRAP
jgi:thiol-disulfide isomerase/thioredoxin